MSDRQKLEIRTPEGVRFSIPLAGPISRFLAFAVDLAIIMLIMQIVNFFGIILNIFSPDIAQAVFIGIYFVVSFGYGIILEWYWGGQTIGKRLLRLRVIDFIGKKLEFSQVFLRNIFRVVDSLPIFYLFGGLVVIFGSHYRRIGDIVGNTVVIRSSAERFQAGRIEVVDKYNSLRNQPGLITRLRQNISPEEADLIYKTLMRRESLEPQTRAELMEQVADYFKGKVRLPEDIIESVTDERLLRNIIDVLFPAEKVSFPQR